jgi:hypothetical protein
MFSLILIFPKIIYCGTQPQPTYIDSQRFPQPYHMISALCTITAKQQLTSPVYHHFANQSPIVKQSFITNHMTKACLGMAIGNQISCHQSTIGFLLIVSQVSELKYFLIFSYYPDWLFSTLRKFALNLHQIV